MPVRLHCDTGERKRYTFTHPSHSYSGSGLGCAATALPFYVPQASVLASPCQWVYRLPPEQLWPLGAPRHERGPRWQL